MSFSPYVKSLKPIDHAAAHGAQKEVLDKALKQVGFIPNMYANMANAPAVLNTYLTGYDLFRKESGLTPAEQEVIFLAISRTNGCTYCTAAHSMIADKMSGVPGPVLQAIRSGSAIPDGRLAVLHDLTVEMVKTLGKPSAATVAAFLRAGFKESDALYIVLAIGVKVLSNYSNHAFGTQVDAAFSAYRVA